MCSLCRFAALAVALTASLALADDPKWVYGKPEDTKGAAVWKSNVQAGLLVSTGNARSVSASAGGLIARSDGVNKVELDANGSYIQSVLPVAIKDPTTGKAVGIDEESKITTQLWNTKLRYDRFLTGHDAVFAAGVATGNIPAGIRVAAGAQLGYSRQLVKNALHDLAVEGGYDFTYQRNLIPPELSIHSLRLFLGYNLTVSKTFGFQAGVEGLFNLTNLPGYYESPMVRPFGNTRVNANAAVTAKVWKNLSFQASWLMKYTTDPAPVVLTGVANGPGFEPRAQRLDTITNLSLVLTLL